MARGPLLLGLCTLLILVGVVVAMLPDLPVMQMVLNLSLLGALLLPIMLFAMVYLMNQKRLMGSYTNGLVYKVIVSVLVGAVSALAVVYLITLVLSFFGSQIL